MLKIKNKTLDWTLKNIEKFGDTDIFPLPFEFKAIRYNWDLHLKDYLHNQNILNWNVRPFRKLQTPKHMYGYRIATQLDPLDTIIFSSLIYEIGDDIEKYRIPKENNIVFSSRFSPNDEGQMFDTNYNWLAFQEQSKKHSENPDYRFVVVADIADFFSRIYSHPLENALKSCTNKTNHTTALIAMLKNWNYSVSYGIPIGPLGSNLLSELAISDVDECLIAENITYCRYVDDFRLFAKSRREAYEHLSLLAKILFENHGLTLQQNKTKILDIDYFNSNFLKSDDLVVLDNLSEKYYDILNKIGVNSLYEEILFEDLDFEIQESINKLNLLDILKEEIEKESDIDSKLVSFLLNRLGQLNNPTALPIILDNVDKLYTVFKNIFMYFDSASIMTKEEKSDTGKKLIELLDTSIIGHLDYHKLWFFNTFANDPQWNNSNEYVKLYNKYSDPNPRRKMILALGRSNLNSWFKTQKRNFDSFTPWEKRAFIAAASCLPGDEASHWYRSINPKLDVLEQSVVRWAKNNPFGRN